MGYLWTASRSAVYSGLFLNGSRAQSLVAMGILPLFEILSLLIESRLSSSILSIWLASSYLDVYRQVRTNHPYKTYIQYK